MCRILPQSPNSSNAKRSYRIKRCDRQSSQTSDPKIDHRALLNDMLLQVFFVLVCVLSAVAATSDMGENQLSTLDVSSSMKSAGLAHLLQGALYSRNLTSISTSNFAKYAIPVFHRHEVIFLCCCRDRRLSHVHCGVLHNRICLSELLRAG